MQSRGRRRAIATATLLVVWASAWCGSQAIAAPGLTISGSATLPDGGGRAIGAVWADQPPYKVNFSCGVPGCSNYVTSSTTTTSLARYISYDVCNSGLFATHQISVWMKAGAGTQLSATSHTTWTAGAAC